MADTDAPRVALLVEDDPIQAAHLRRAVEAAGIAVWACPGTGQEAQALIAQGPSMDPALIIVDLRLPDGSGVDVLRAAHERWPDVVSLVSSVLSDEEHVVAALRAGAQGYVLKDSSVDELTDAIHQVLKGHCPLSPAIARHLLRQLRDGAGGTEAPRLTPRETDILRAIAAGYSYVEAGDRLGVSLSTVETHIRNLYKKLKAHTKAEAVAHAKMLGIL